jgi:phosphatidylserine/phosphatidylglycerophosphate/cardiolipin synthase-like enzyme
MLMRSIIFSAVFFISLDLRAEVSVLFSPNGGVKDEIIERLNQATDHIDIAMYSFSDKDILEVVKNRSRDGVPIRLILNKAQRRGALSSELVSAGIEVRYIIPVMHHKFAIIDGSRNSHNLRDDSILITGSANWSKRSNTDYDEDVLIFKDQQLKIQSYQREFEHLWKYARTFERRGRDEVSVDGLFDGEAEDFSTVFTSSNFDVYLYRDRWVFRAVVPYQEGVAGRKVIEAIDQAEEIIEIAATHMRRKDIYLAIKRALERGVKVRMILDQQEFRGRPSNANITESSDLYFDEQLSAEGADVRYKVYMKSWRAFGAMQMHLKYLIIDRQTVLTGSFNWSANSEINSMENLNTLKSDVVAAYRVNFSKIFAYGGKHGAQKLIDLVRRNEGLGPCRFPAISLTVAEFEKLRASYVAGACRR